MNKNININALIQKMRQKNEELKDTQKKMFDLEKESAYLLRNGELFTQKMLIDLRMWRDFATKYKYTSIMQLRQDLEELKEYRKRYGKLI